MSTLEHEEIEFRWGVEIPLRDGVRLNATVYRPKGAAPAPCITALTPYTCDHLHDRGVYFARHGLPFVAVDVRGRGNSQGVFQPNIQEVRDAHDVVEWLARQPYCNGKVAMFGGSYMGYAQWAAVKDRPAHLATIVPTAAPYIGVDVPIRNNIFSAYYLRWLTVTSGRASQWKLFGDHSLWSAMFRRWRESGASMREADVQFGNPSPIFQEWLSHPHRDAYWDAHNPTAEEYARLDIPVLTITGVYDGDQPGALEHYKQHLRHASPEARARHYLIIGPWDHAGTGMPCADFGGLRVGTASVIDMLKLHREWYAWAMQGGPKPEFLQKNVAYYVMGADRWCYADTLEEITACSQPLYLQSSGNPTDVFDAGCLSAAPPDGSPPDHYVYDPRDTSFTEIESKLESTTWIVNQTTIHASTGRQLIYHSVPFEADTEVSGFFKLNLWFAIDQPDTDFQVRIYEIDVGGSSIELTRDAMRARYRESLREAKLIRTTEPLRYDFEQFTFVSRLIRAGHRLRLVIGPVNSSASERNYNAGGVVAEESMKDARPVTVRLFHDAARSSVLFMPLGRSHRINRDI